MSIAAAARAIGRSAPLLLPMAEQVETTVAVVSEKLSGQDLSISGEVRLGTPEGLAVCFLTPNLKPLLDEYPRLTVELLALPRLANLASREADLAITLDDMSLDLAGATINQIGQLATTRQDIFADFLYAFGTKGVGFPRPAEFRKSPFTRLEQRPRGPARMR